MRSVFFLMLMSFAAKTGWAQENHPVSWKFSSEPTAQGTFRINFTAAIRAPFHIYPQTFDGGLGMPTTITIEDNPNIELVGEMEEKGAEPSTGGAVAYYATGVTFSQTIRLKTDEQTTLRFRIKYMACNDQMCLPPSSKQFTLVVNDKNGVGTEQETVTPSPDKAPSVLRYEDFTMPDTKGKKVDTKTITSRNKYTFIDFWASWCAPCRAQARELVPLYKKYSKTGFAVIGISLDTDAVRWKKAISDDGYTWTNLSDLKGFESPVSIQYNIKAIPRNMLIDSKGNIVAMDLHGNELEDKLAELLK